MAYRVLTPPDPSSVREGTRCLLGSGLLTGEEMIGSRSSCVSEPLGVPIGKRSSPQRFRLHVYINLENKETEENCGINLHCSIFARHVMRYLMESGIAVDP